MVKEFGRQPRYVMQSWTVGQGLPQNSVLSLCRTHDGFLWIGTLGGLAQFDGARFRVFRSIDGNTVPSDAIKYLAEDKAGTLWIGSSKTITRYRAGSFTAFTAAPDFIRDGVTDMKADADGGVWLVNRSGQVLYTDGSVTTIVKTPAVVNVIAASPAGGVWAASHNGFFLLRGKKAASKTWGAGSSFSSIYVSRTNTVVVRSGENTFALRGNSLSLWRGFRKSWHAATQGAGEQIWMTSDSGIVLVEDGRIERELTPQEGLADSDIETLLGEGDGSIWAGGYTSGLQLIYSGVFTTYDHRDGLPESPYELVAADATGAVWIGGTVTDADSSKNFLGRIASNGVQIFGKSNGLIGEQAMGVASGKGGDLTLAVAPAGLFRFQGGQFKQFFKSTPGTYPTAMLRDHAGNLWFSLHGGALHEMPESGGERVFSEKEGLLDTAIWSLAEDHDGNIWVASSKGVTLLHQKENYRAERFPLGFVGSVYASRDGEIWLGSFQGLRYYDGKDFRVLTQKDGLPSDTVISMTKDAAGNLWAGSANGIFRLESDELKRWTRGEAVKFHVRVFGSNDGLLSSQVIDIGQNTLTTTPDKRLWFATTKGLSVIDPKSLHNEPLQASVQQVSVDGVRQDGGSEFVVSPGRHTLKIEYTAPQLIDAKRVVFAYRLEGWDKEWVKAGSSREVSYAGLPPGKYDFHVRAEYGDASGPVSTIGFALMVKPYFYQTRWFDFSVLLAAGYMLWLLYKVRIRVSEKRLEALYQARLDERNQIARQLHDTLIQDVVGTALGLEVLSERLPENSAGDKQDLDCAVESLQGVIRRGRLALVELRSEEAGVGDLALALRRAKQQLWRGEHPVFELQVNGESPAFLVPLYDDVYNIAREAMINALRHSRASLIRISLAFTPTSIEVLVADNGHGKSDLLLVGGRSGHFGLQTMAERAARVRGKLSISSSADNGTSVKLTVMRSRMVWWHRSAFVTRSDILARFSRGNIGAEVVGDGQQGEQGGQG